MKNYLKKYRDLEQEVLRELSKKVKNGKPSKYISANCIKATLLGYDELVIVNDRLAFIDSDGLHYDVFSRNLEELIELLNEKL